MTPGARSRMEDEWEMRRIAMIYAQAADRNDGDAFASVFTEDAVIEGPGFRVAGRADIARNPSILRQMFAATLHTVLNQTVTIAGDSAHGETYCLAYHLNHPRDGKQTKLDWAIRYQDAFRRQDGGWLFSHRRLIVEWAHTTPVDPSGA